MKKYILSLLIGTALLSSCLDVDIVDRVEKRGRILQNGRSCLGGY